MVIWIKIASNGITNGLSLIQFSDIFHSFDIYNKGIAICKIKNIIAISSNDLLIWNEITLPYISYCSSPLWVTYKNVTTLYVGDISMKKNGNRIIKTIDRGLTWISCSNGLPDIPIVHLVASLDESVLYVGMYIGIYTSINQGVTWSQLGSSLPNVGVYSILPSETGKIVVATYGRGVWEFTYPSIASSNNESSTLSTGNIALITILTTCGGILFLLGIYYLFVRCKQNRDNQDKPSESPVVSNTTKL